MDVKNFIHHGGSGVTPLQVGDVGHVASDWKDDGRFAPSGDMDTDRADATAEWVRYMDVPYPGGGYGRGGHAGGGDLCGP